jgi:hypothetical protein
MQTFLIILHLVFSLSFPALSLADSQQSSFTVNKSYFQRDPVFNNRTNVYDKRGRRKDCVEQDALFKDIKNAHNLSYRKKLLKFGEISTISAKDNYIAP